jgi:hypothetical protein
MANRITPELVERIVNLIPDTWLVGNSSFEGANRYRDAYVEYLLKRLEPPHLFLEEAIRARSLYV